jgi:SAM-dependent methyltransferase
VSEWLDRHSTPGYGAVYNASLGSGYWGAHWENLERPALVKELKRCRSQGASTLLDLACGTGRVLSAAQEVFALSVGADASSAMLALAAKEHRRLVLCDSAALAFRNAFDVITAFRFMLNASDDLRLNTLRSIRAVLRDPGWFISNVHVNAHGPSGVAYRAYNQVNRAKTFRTLSVRQYEAILSQSGFFVERTIWLGALPRTVKALDRPAARLLLPVERMARRFRVPPEWSQSFMVVSRPI